MLSKETDMNTMLIVGVVIYLLYTCMNGQNSSMEHFKLFEPRQDLRGFPIYTSDIKHKYIYPDNNWRLHDSSGVMYESRWRPHETEGNCGKNPCPPIFDRKDTTCWNCNNCKK
jgi:hypothetical protein